MQNTELIEKLAQSFRQRITITNFPDHRMGGVEWRMHLGDKLIGTMRTRGNQVHFSHIEREFRSLGLGKKMYGEVARHMPGNRLMSDAMLSPLSTRLWESLRKDPDGWVGRKASLLRHNVGFRAFRVSTFGAPQYQATLPAAAARAKSTVVLGTGRILPEAGRLLRRELLTVGGSLAAIGGLVGGTVLHGRAVDRHYGGLAAQR